MPAPPSPGGAGELEAESLGRAAGAVGRDVPPEDAPTLGAPADRATESGASAEPTGAFVVALGAFVESAEEALTFTVTAGVFGDGVGAFVGAGELFTDTVGVVSVTPAFVVETDGVVTEMLGKVTVPTGVLTGTADVPTVTEGRLSDEAVGTCASATTSVEAKHAERAFLRDFIWRAIHNS